MTVEETGRNKTVNGPTDDETLDEVEPRQGQKPVHISRAVKVLLASCVVTGVVIAGIVRWSFLPPSDRYFLPASPDDWAAWGTWAGAFGSIGAVFFASQSIKHAIEAQRGTERELKRDRIHDRIEREKERALVREEREALTKQVDRIALNEAQNLSFSYNAGLPADSEYAEVQIRWNDEEQRRYERAMDAEEENDDQQTKSACVIIQNASKDLVFEDITLWLREDRLTVTGVEVADRDAPPVRKSSEYLDGTPPKWTWRTDFDSVFPSGTNQWALGSVKAGRQLVVKLSFANAQHYMDWDPMSLWADEPGLRGSPTRGPWVPRHRRTLLGTLDALGTEPPSPVVRS